MSEFHTQQLRLAEYERLYSEALDQNQESERIISRMERHNEATNEQISNLEAAYERQNYQFNQVTSQLQSNLRQQEERHQQQIAESRKEHVRNLRNVALNFNNQMGKFRNDVANQFKTERRNTKAMIDNAQHKSREMINGVRKELTNRLNEQDQKIKNIQSNVEVLRSDLEKLKGNDAAAANLAKDYINDLKLLISEEEKRQQYSLFQKPAYCDRGVPLLSIYKSEISKMETLLNSGQNFVAASQALELYKEFTIERLKVLSAHQSISEKYRAVLSEYKSLIDAAEKSKQLSIEGIDTSSLKYNEANKSWTEGRTPLKVDVDFWTGGKLQAFIEKHKPQFEKINAPEFERNHQIDEKFIENLREKILGEAKSYQAAFEAIIKEAKELALTSNLREVLAEKALNRLRDKYQGSLSLEEKGFELNDPKNNYHLRLKINGVERHLILGNNNDAKTITSTIMEGGDYTGNKEAFEQALKEQIEVMKDAGIELEPNGAAIQSHSNACASSKEFISKGMLKELKESVGITG